MKRLIVLVLVLALASMPALASLGSAGRFFGGSIGTLQATAKEAAMWTAFKGRLVAMDLGDKAEEFYQLALYCIRSGRRLPSLSELRGLARGVRYNYPLFRRSLNEVLRGRPEGAGATASLLWRNYKGVVIGGGIVLGLIAARTIALRGIRQLGRGLQLDQFPNRVEYWRQELARGK